VELQDAGERRFAQRLGEPDLRSSTGWLFRFRNGHGVANRKICGESLIADDASVEPVPENTLPNKYDSSLPGRKINKERLTALVCANADGCHRLKPVITGSSAKPRRLKHVIRDLSDILCPLPSSFE
jgi:hypothetical protein